MNGSRKETAAGKGALEPESTFWVQGKIADGWEDLRSCTDKRKAISELSKVIQTASHPQFRLVEESYDRIGCLQTTLLLTVDNPPQSQPNAVAAPVTPPSAARPERLPPRREAESNGHRGRRLVLAGLMTAAVLSGVGIAGWMQGDITRLAAKLGPITQLLPQVSADRSAPTLEDAIRSGDAMTVRTALLNGADPNARNTDGVPLLLDAARNAPPMVVEQLLLGGANPAMPLGAGKTVLHAAAEEGLTVPLDLMIRSGAPVDQQGGRYGCLTPLSMAAAAGKTQTALFLAESGASLDPVAGCDIGPADFAAASPALLDRLGLQARTSDPLPTPAQPLHMAAAVSIDEDAPETSNAPPAPAPAARVTPDAGPAAPRAPEVTQIAAASTIPPVDDPRAIGTVLPDLIAAGQLDAVAAALEKAEATVDIAALSIIGRDLYGAGYRSPVDHALFHGHGAIAEHLLSRGQKPGPDVLHRLVEKATTRKLEEALSVLSAHDYPVDGLSGGLTPLMKAVILGDAEKAALLAAHGADPDIRTESNQTAFDFAALSGSSDLHLRLLLATRWSPYKAMTFGLDWRATMDDMRDMLQDCETVSGGFAACTLAVDPWLDDVAGVVAQFDTRNGNRLIALQMDSRLFSNELDARRRFDAVAGEIAARLPAGQPAFTDQEVARGVAFFEGLRPGTGEGRYAIIWPDNTRRHPALVELKMIGHRTRSGFYRVIIANPFAVSTSG